MIERRVFLLLILFYVSENFIEREPISDTSKWDPGRRKRGDSTTPADTIPAGWCLVPFLPLFARKKQVYSLSYGIVTDDSIDDKILDLKCWISFLVLVWFSLRVLSWVFFLSV